MSKVSPTVRQLASLAAVSRTTVSLALRNHPSISPATRQRIQQLADEHGYTSDPVYSQLMNQFRVRRSARTKEKIAFLTFGDNPDEWRVKSYNDRNYFQGACERAEKLGYELEVIWAKEPKMNGRRLSKILHTRSIRGLIIPPLPRPYGHLSLEWQHFTAVSLSHNLFKPALHRVAHFHSEGMLLALRHTRRRGYRRVGYVNLCGQDARSHHGWLASYLAYQQDYEPKTRIPPLLMPVWKPASFSKWLKDHRVDAIISNWPQILNAPSELGCKIGEELGVASLDVQPAPGKPDYAGIDQQPTIQGWVAVDIVVSGLQHNEFGLPSHPRITHLGGVWVDGPTVVRRDQTAATAPKIAKIANAPSNGQTASRSKGR